MVESDIRSATQKKVPGHKLSIGMGQPFKTQTTMDTTKEH